MFRAENKRAAIAVSLLSNEAAEVRKCVYSIPKQDSSASARSDVVVYVLSRDTSSVTLRSVRMCSVLTGVDDRATRLQSSVSTVRISSN